MACAFVTGAVMIAAAVILMLKNYSDVGVYICYALAAVSFVYIVYMLIYGIPKIKGRMIELASHYEFTDNIVKNFGFRTFVLSCASFAINILYVIYNGAISVYYLSVWYAALTFYYLMFCLIRGGLIFGAGNNRRMAQKSPREKEEIKLRAYLHCGIWLIVLSCVIVAVISGLTATGRSEQRNSNLIYVIALYTTIRIVLAVRNLIRAKREKDTIAQALRNISMADALVSLLSLQTEMLSAFGGNFDAVRLDAAVGFCICTLIILIGVVMIVGGSKSLKSLRSEEKNGA